MRTLIINADDFGMTAGVTAGISKAMTEGVVSTTSVMACVQGSLERASAYVSTLRGRMGVHLQLTDGWPSSADIPSLITESGCFPRNCLYLKGVEPQEVRREWHEQMKRVLDYGIVPSHIDTHHHVHRFPVIFGVYCEIAAIYNLAARTLTREYTAVLRQFGIRCADYCEIGWYNEPTPEQFLRRVQAGLSNCPCGVLELMCHPGYCDSDLPERSSYTDARQLELEALCDPSLRHLLQRSGIEVVQRRIEL